MGLNPQHVNVFVSRGADCTTEPSPTPSLLFATDPHIRDIVDDPQCSNYNHGRMLPYATQVQPVCMAGRCTTIGHENLKKTGYTDDIL